MANPASRQQLIDYCLRRLGHPVIEINVDDDQLEDRIDEALQYYREFHYDAVEQVYLKVRVEASNVVLDGNGNSFVAGETVSGLGNCYIEQVISDNLIKVRGLTQEYSNVIALGNSSGTSANVISTSLGNFDNKYFDVSDAVTGITKVLPFTNRTSGMDIFDIRYQILINDLYTLQSTDLIYYTQIKQHLELINMMLVGAKPIRFNRHMNRLYVDMSWGVDAKIGDYLIIECTRILDPNTFTDVYNDMFLKRYATALFKRQWGENLKKFEGVQLPGGVTLNGQKIYEEAIDEIEKLQQEMRDTWEEPPMFLVG